MTRKCFIITINVTIKDCKNSQANITYLICFTCSYLIEKIYHCSQTYLSSFRGLPVSIICFVFSDFNIKNRFFNNLNAFIYILLNLVSPKRMTVHPIKRSFLFISSSLSIFLDILLIQNSLLLLFSRRGFSTSQSLP